MAFYQLSEGGLDEAYLDWDLYVRTPRDFEPPSHWYMETASIQAEYVPLTIRCGRSTKKYPDFLSYGSLHFVSDRLRNLASQLGDINAEFLPVTLVTKPGTPVSLNPYWCLHFLEAPDFIAHEQSEIEFWSPRRQIIKGIKKLAFDASKVGGRPLFMTFGLGMVFVSQSLTERAQTGNLHITLTPVEQVRLGAIGLAKQPSRFH